jgi:CDP-glucose 4,6-dehydratase
MGSTEEMQAAFGGAFRGMPVLVTGHTGFKGSWLSIWLKELGAEVIGYSVDVPTAPSNFEASRLGQRMVDVRGDVRDLDALCRVIEEHKPRAVFHLAAQPIVRLSYAEPKETFDVNVGGTINLLEAVRLTDSIKTVVCITSDKCYENREWLWGYREIDRLGGHDPYSASKAMAELAVASYRQSFFPAETHDGVSLASVRAGNVIGGGDWAQDRLVVDCMRALMDGEPIPIRNPHSVRPWQLVLEPLSGYLWLAAKLVQEGGRYAEAWNFAPPESVSVRVGDLVQELIVLWGAGEWQDLSAGQAQAPHETSLLRLSWEKAANRLGWRAVYDWHEAAAETVSWFKVYHEHGADMDMYDACVGQVARYVGRARELGILWAL